MSHIAASRCSSGFVGDRDAFYEGKPKYEYRPEAYTDENGVLRWGLDLHPYDNVRLDQSRERDPLHKRIGRWLREIGREEGHDIPPHVDDVHPTEFTGFVWREGPTTNAWLHAVEETGHLDPDPLADEVIDPRLVKDFKFVQKRAYKRKMSELESRRLHIVFRASTEEKIKRIKELCESLLPFIVEEKAQNTAADGIDDAYYEDASVNFESNSYDSSSYDSYDDDYDYFPYNNRYNNTSNDHAYSDDAQNFWQKTEHISYVKGSDILVGVI